MLRSAQASAAELRSHRSSAQRVSRRDTLRSADLSVKPDEGGKIAAGNAGSVGTVSTPQRPQVAVRYSGGATDCSRGASAARVDPNQTCGRSG